MNERGGRDAIPSPNHLPALFALRPGRAWVTGMKRMETQEAKRKERERWGKDMPHTQALSVAFICLSFPYVLLLSYPIIYRLSIRVTKGGSEMIGKEMDDERRGIPSLSTASPIHLSFSPGSVKKFGRAQALGTPCQLAGWLILTRSPTRKPEKRRRTGVGKPGGSTSLLGWNPSFLAQDAFLTPKPPSVLMFFAPGARSR